MTSFREKLKKFIKKQGVIKTSQLISKFGISRQAIHRYIKELENDGSLIRQGSSRVTTCYLFNDPAVIGDRRAKTASFKKRCPSAGLEEDVVFQEIDSQVGLLAPLTSNAKASLRYAFTEMLNNAIDHSGSKFIDINININKGIISFDIRDYGVGIFTNIQTKIGLSSEMEAIQDVLKGKQTSMPERHSGEGIFFTSKVADLFTIESHRKRVTINNRISDIFVDDRRSCKGTNVHFEMGVDSKKDVTDIFKVYTNENFSFDKSRISVKLFDSGETYMSRSQAKRLLHSLENFKVIVLDFNGVKTVGQAFADEIFRVFGKTHPDIKIEPLNCDENVQFMIRHVNSLGVKE